MLKVPDVAPTIIDLFENFLGEELSPYSIQALNKLSINQFKELLYHLWDFEGISMNNTEPDNNTYVFLDIDLLGYDELREIGVERYVNRIKHILLYYPRIQVFHDLDPMSIMFSGKARSYIKAFLKIYIVLKPLIQSHILVVSSYPLTSVTEPIIEELNLYDSKNPDLILTVEQVISERKYRQVNLRNPLAILDGYNISQVLSSTTNTHWTARSEGDMMIHSKKLDAARQDISSIQNVELWAMDALGRLNLPKIDEISPKELVSIRFQEDAFEEWRKRLSLIMVSVPQEIQFNDRVIKEIRDYASSELIEPIVKLQERKSGASIQKRLQDSSIGFGIGAMSLVFQHGFGLITNLTESLYGLGIGTGTALFLSQLFRKMSKKDQLLMKYYTLFDENEK